MHSVRRRLMACAPLAALTTSVVLALAGCGQAVTDTAAAPTATRASYVDDNCGISTTHTTVPRRAVSLTSNATETLLELGLHDKMAGTAYMRGRPIAATYAEDYRKVKVISSEQPTMEQLLEVNPDFVYAGYPDGFTEKSGHTREQLQAKGITTHLNPEGCSAGKMSVEDIFTEITTIGKIFDVEDRAQSSVTALRQRVAAVHAKVGTARPIKVFLYSKGDDKANTTGGRSMATALIEAAGGQNIFDDVNERWMSVSWEQVAARNPDVILVREEGNTAQYKDPSVEDKVKTLRGIKAIEATTAMKNGAFVTVNHSQLQPGPFSVDGIEAMAAALHPDTFR